MAGSVYVGSSLFNAERVRQIQKMFRDAGIRISYDWTQHGQIVDDELLAHIGDLEEKGVIDCDLFFMIHPSRNGSHCELGMARVLQKHIVILEEGPPIEKKTFYYRPTNHHRPIHRFTNATKAVAFAIDLLKENQ